MTRRALTDDQAREALELYQQGTPMSWIGHKYGVTKECLNSYRKLAGVPVRQRGRSLDECRVVALWNEGVSLTAIADQCGVKPQRIDRVLRAAGIEPVDRRGVLLSVDQQRELARLHAEGWTTTQLVARYGVEKGTVPRVVKRWGGTTKSGRRPYRHFSEEEVERMTKLWDDGWSQTAIAGELNAAQVTISRVLRAHGIVPTPRQSRARGADHGSWKGGRSVGSGGYVLVLMAPDDPLAAMRLRQGYAFEHRLVMARALGRALTENETVHHINGDKADNRLENLQLRQGRHGKGVVMRCRCCGSTDIESAPIAAPED